MTDQTTPPLDLPALKEIAKAATSQSPWWATIVDNVIFAGNGESGNLEVAETSMYNDSLHIAAFDPPTALAIIQRAETAESACKTLAEVLAKHSEWVIEATDSQSVISEDGDGDWDVVWDRVMELGEKAREATARAEAAEKAVAAVRELHKPVEVYEYDTINGVFVTDADGEQIVMATLCGMCTSSTILENIGDCEYDGPGLFDEVSCPCPTIAALDTHTPETETTP